MTRTRYLYFFFDKGHFRRFLWGLTALAFLAGLGMIFIPLAHAAAFSCTSAGAANGNLFAQDTIGNQIANNQGAATTITTPTGTISNGDPFASGGACNNASLGVFGRIICYFKTAVGQIVSTMYCGFQNKLLQPLSMAIELFIVIVGVGIMTGITNFTIRDGILAILKIAIIWAFAMNATWGIGVAYTFFMGLAEQGTSLVLNAVGTSGSAGPGMLLTQPDKVLQSFIAFSSTGSGAGSSVLPASLAANPSCALWLIILLVLFFLFLPMVFASIVTLILQYLMLYVRALLGYLTAIVLISFLFILSPIFISFALFKVTYPMFEQWLKYLTSFALQVVVIFAFISVLNLVPIGDFFTEILGLLRTYDTTTLLPGIPTPVTICSVCKGYTISSTAYLGSGTIPITCPATAVTAPDGQPAYSLLQLFQQQDLVEAIVGQAVALWIIASVMQDFIKRAPEVARELAGKMQYAPALGGGTLGLNGVPTITYPGMDYVEGGIGRLRQGITNSSLAMRGQWAAATLGALAGTAILAGTRGTPGTSTTAGGSSGSGSSGKSSTGYGGALAQGFNLSGGSDATQDSKMNTMLRPIVQRASLAYDEATLTYNQSQEQLSQSTAALTEQWGVLNGLQPGTDRWRDEFHKLELARQDYMAQLSGNTQSLNAKMQEMLGYRAAIGSGAMSNQASQSGTPAPADSSYSYDQQASPGVAQVATLQPSDALLADRATTRAMTYTEASTMLKKTIESLQLQLNVQQVLKAGSGLDFQYLQGKIEQAISQASTAQNKRDIQDIIDNMLREVQNALA